MCLLKHILSAVVSIGCSEKINEFMAANYNKFQFKQQYFDSYGMFISLIYSAPVLVNCVIILVIDTFITQSSYGPDSLFRSTGFPTLHNF